MFSVEGLGIRVQGLGFSVEGVTGCGSGYNLWRHVLEVDARARGCALDADAHLVLGLVF